jgi:curved DNA-binding protein CbpA
VAVFVDRTDPYAVLGLTPQATQEQIRRAYRALLRENHPDTRRSDDQADNAASNATLLQVNAAYAALGDPARRAGYDHRTSPQRTMTPTRVRPAMRSASNAPDQPPIQAGPVRWHGSRR